MNIKNPKNTDEYIGLFPENIANILKQIRKTIKQTAPKATETISYGMPAFQINGKPLVYFAAFKKHIGFYALPSGNDAFKKELQNYKTGKGSIQFPLNKEIPFNLIVKIVTFRIEEIKKNERI